MFEISGDDLEHMQDGTPKSELRNSLNDSLVAFKNVIQSANEVIPFVVFASLLLASVVISVSMISVGFMMGLTIVVVLTSTLVVYANTQNYGEATLALVAGLLTVFTVEWTKGTYIAFMFAWLGFSLAALIISSIRIAAQSEEIYVDASIVIAGANSTETRKKLEAIGKDKAIKMMGPIARAETLRLFAYRKLPIESMPYALKMVEVLKTLTGVDCSEIALFVADIHKMFKASADGRYHRLLDQIYATIRRSPVAPVEFINAFKYSRRIALSHDYSPETYLAHLTEALENGVPPEDVYEYLLERIPKT